MTTLELTEGHYEVHEAPYGKIYAWQPGYVTVECECGEKLSFTSFKATCNCGRDHTGVVREELAARQLGDKALHPWRYSEEREDTGIPY